MNAIILRRFLGFLALLSLAVAPYAAWAVDEDFDGTIGGEWLFYDSAYHDTGNGWVEMTSSTDYVQGAVFYDQTFSTTRLAVEFDIYVGSADGGADGAVFAFVRDPGLGSGGGQMGFLTGLDGYGIEFDNYDGHDTTPGPESENHVGVSRADPAGPGEAFMINSDIPDLENDSWFHAEVLVESGHVQMWLTNDSIGYARTQVIDYTIAGWEDYDAYVGFTGATGGAVNMHAVDNIVINKGADAGKPQVVWTGDAVTLDGSASNAALSFHWAQTAGSPTVTLDNPNPPDGISHFTAPALTVGTILTFELTVQTDEGPSAAATTVTIRAKNAPVSPPSNLQTKRSDKGFLLSWDPMVDADNYVIEIEVAPTIWFTLATVATSSYPFLNLEAGREYIIRLKARNTYGDSAPSDVLTYVPMANVAKSAANGGTTPPTGNVYVISHYAIAGMNNGAYDDNNDSWDGNAKTDDYWGYLWDSPLYFDEIVYVTGQTFFDGGWFTDMKIEYTEDGTTWMDVPIFGISPAYDFTNAPGGRDDFVRYDINFATVRGLGIRIAGTPGGMLTFTSIGELEVYGDQTQGPLIVQGVDADVPENGTATLDGSYSFSELGPVSGHTWAQLSGPTVTIADPNAPVTTFDTFPVDADEVLVFSLTATDGTNTATDNNVRIIVKNVVTTAVAGPDQLLPEGSPVTLDASGSLTSSGNLTYAWTQLTGPTVTLTGANEKVCTFTAPAIWEIMTQLTFQLEVNDGVGGISQDEVNINLTNPLFGLTPLGTSYFQDLLHLGQDPMDRFLAPLAQSLDTNDYLVSWGGQANVNPMAGEEYDFTDTGIDTTSNPMVWTPEHQDNGWFAYDGRASGAFENFGQIYHVYVFSPETRQARLHARFDDGMRIWNNGGVAMSRDTWDTGVEQYQNFTLNAGVNSMTLRVEEIGGGNEIAARITDRDDVPYTDLSYALSIPNPLPLAYAVRSLPGSYQAGGPLTVDLSVRADSDNLSGSVSITEAIPPGTTVANAGGGQIFGGNISWNIANPSISTISYTLNVTAGTAGGMNFAGNVNYTGIPTQGIYGDWVVYETPSAPTNLSVEMLIGGHVSWSASSQEGVVGYRVYSSVNGQPFTEIGYVTGSSYVDSFALPGSTYNYKVSSVNAGGVEGPLSAATGEKMISMEIREAEDYNYGGGQYPGYTLCPAAVEATATDDLAAGNDFFFATDIPVGDYRRDYRPNDNCGIETVLDDGTTDVWHTNIGWTTIGDWWRYTFDVSEAGWIKLSFRVAAPTDTTLAAYWDETLVGSVTFNTGSWHTLTDAVIEDQIQTTAGAHTLRVELVSGAHNFDQVGLGTGWGPPKRGVIWDDDFEDYANLYGNADLTAAGWTVVNGGGDPNGAWRLWNTAGNDLSSQSADIGGMTDNYVITDSDLAPEAMMAEELITPPIDCTDYAKVRLDFAKNYRAYLDDTVNAQIAEVDIRSSDDGIVWGSWVNLYHYDTTTVPAADPAEDVAPEQIVISQYADGKQIQVRFHFFEAQYDYWFAVDSIVVTGELGEEPPVPPATLHPDGSLSWEPFGGGNYTVQYKDDLSGGVWNNVPGTWPTTATTWPGEDTSALPNRYYRVMSE